MGCGDYTTQVRRPRACMLAHTHFRKAACLHAWQLDLAEAVYRCGKNSWPELPAQVLPSQKVGCPTACMEAEASATTPLTLNPEPEPLPQRMSE